MQQNVDLKQTNKSTTWWTCENLDLKQIEILLYGLKTIQMAESMQFC